MKTNKLVRVVMLLHEQDVKYLKELAFSMDLNRSEVVRLGLNMMHNQLTRTSSVTLLNALKKCRQDNMGEPKITTMAELAKNVLAERRK
jgi:hypothetical protein